MERRTILILYLIVSIPISFFTVSFLYDYVTWIEPLNSITSKDILFLDKGTHQGNYGEDHFSSMKSSTYVKDETGEHSVIIEIQSHKYSHMIPNGTDYSATLRQGDMFIVDCKNDHERKNSDVEAFYVASMNSTYIEFHHYLLIMNDKFQCKFPEIIEHGLNMKWPEFNKHK